MRCTQRRLVAREAVRCEGSPQDRPTRLFAAHRGPSCSQTRSQCWTKLRFFPRYQVSKVIEITTALYDF
jgi:hypothetical protein